MKKRILLIAKSFFPVISPRSFRVTELAREFAREGHAVVIYTVTGDYDYSDFEKKYNLTVKNLGNLRFREISLRGSRHTLLWRRALRRILLLFFEYPAIELMFAISAALKNESGYNLMISFAPTYPVHWGCAKAIDNNRLLCETWIADCGDPYMGCKTDSFRKPFYFKYIEKWFCIKADYITIPKEEMKVNYYSEFRSKIKIIPQGFCFENVKTCKDQIKNKVPTFAFAGSFIKGIRDPRGFLDYLSTLKQNFKFILYTNSLNLLSSYTELLVDKIEIRPYVQREELLYVLSQMDFLVNFEYDPAIQSPSKLIDYALTGRPILSLSSNNLDKTTIQEFLKGDYKNRFEVTDIQQYNIVNVARKFLSLC